MSKFAGADWVKTEMSYKNPGLVMSVLGTNVADFLGELFQGIYHLDPVALKKVDWENNSFIEVSIGWTNWSTVDYDNLSTLVFLAHHMALRVGIEASTHKYMKLIFHQRSRSGKFYQKCPTLDEAVKTFKETVNLPEFQD
jgi:hypothetical protein